MRVTLFLCVCFAVSWGIWAPLVFDGVSEKTSWLLYYGGVVGPAIAAFLCATRESLIRRSFQWRVPVIWYVVAIALPFATRAVALTAVLLLDDRRPLPAFRPLAAIAGITVLVLLLVPFEEIGWRGFLLPLLQRRYSPLASSLVIAVIWALWHVPLAWASVGYQRTPRPWLYMLQFFITIIPISCLMTWLFNRTSESIIIATLFHAAINVADYVLVLPPDLGQAVLFATTALLAAAAIYLISNVSVLVSTSQ